VRRSASLDSLPRAMLKKCSLEGSAWPLPCGL
jgi:hypothetical protein